MINFQGLKKTFKKTIQEISLKLLKQNYLVTNPKAFASKKKMVIWPLTMRTTVGNLLNTLKNS